jgi:hypothetical protein
MASMVTTEFLSHSLGSSIAREEEEESEDEPLVPPPSCWFENSYPLTLGTSDNSSSIVEREESPSQDEKKTVAGVRVPINPSHYAPAQALANTHPSPSWKEISSQVLPNAARELLTSSLRRIYYTAQLSYARGRWHRKYSDIGNNTGGFNLSSSDLELPNHLLELPPFSSLPWIDRQLVSEWRTYLPDTPEEMIENEDFDFDRARALVPNPIDRPKWQKTDVCHECHKPFGPTRLRHHCRLCGFSFCQSHSSSSHRLPHLGYDPDVPERACDGCKRTLLEQNLAERVAWRLGRCRDYSDDSLTPYFETGLDTAQDVAIRITKAAIAMAKSIPLGAQATVAVETVDVLRKHGLHGIYGIMLRQEFLAAADLLRRALGINKTSWPLSVHELSAAIFYALAQHRAIRGLNPEREEVIHTFRSASQRSKQTNSTSIATWTDTRGEARPGDVRTGIPTLIDNYELSALSFHNNPIVDQTDTYNPDVETIEHMTEKFDLPMRDPRKREQAVPMIGERPSFTPVCDPVPDSVFASLIFYAPIALNFIYATKEVDMQLLAAQQDWRLLYAFLDQDKSVDRPASALFLHEERKIACLSIRGTATINDVITDIRQMPVPFPDNDPEHTVEKEDDWTSIFQGQGVALNGMASAAINLFREHIDSLVSLAKQGYRIRITGHSLGGGVATMIGILVLRHLERYTELTNSLKSGTTLEESDLLRVYAYGTPSCVDAKLADSVDSFVTTVILHDDVFPRLTPTSCRGLLKHLLHIRETWVKTQIGQDLRAVGARARSVWAPKFRQSFTLTSSSKSIKKYCKKQYKEGKKKLLSVKGKIAGETSNVEGEPGDVDCSESHNNAFVEADESFESDPSQWGEKFFVPTTAGSIGQSLDSALEEDEGEHDAENDGEEDPPPQLLLEFLGGVDNRTEGIVIDGDEFFDTEVKLVESDDESFKTSSDCVRDSPTAPMDESLEVSGSWSLEFQGGESAPEQHTSSAGVPKDDSSDENGPAAVVLEEAPLPRMFVPGKVIHIYSHRGVYKTAYVPRTFRELRRISLAGNMLSNHTTKAYYEGLLEVQTAKDAPERPPRWTAFDEDDTCCCCASRFTWASTSDSEAQEARDKHNCRSCGGLVCDPCAKNRVPIPSIGITVPVRVCDRCYNDLGGHSVASSSMTSSFLAVDEDMHPFRDSSPGRQACDPMMTTEREMKEAEERPERKREKRSLVVDDLASRIRSSALTTCL